MLNIVIPMAGRGSRFVAAGYKNPKPFIDVDGTAMILRVMQNLIPYQPHRFIFIARREHESFIKQHMSFAANVIYIDEVTEGAACTVLLAEKLINSNNQLIIANSDQLVTWNKAEAVFTLNAECNGPDMYWKESNNIQDMINDAEANDLSASIATFKASHPKWSYAKVNSLTGLVEEVAEKKVISDDATVGVYYYQRGRNFVRAAKRMIKKNIRVNGEFYVCPVFNEIIGNGGVVGNYEVDSMRGLGTPEDLERYLSDKSNRPI